MCTLAELGNTCVVLICSQCVCEEVDVSQVCVCVCTGVMEERAQVLAYHDVLEGEGVGCVPLCKDIRVGVTLCVCLYI